MDRPRRHLEDGELARGALFADFLLLLRADRESGSERVSAEYRTLFPGIEDLVEQELTAGAAAEPDGRQPGSLPPLESLAIGLAEGAVVDDFRLLHLLGRGGMGEVWRAEQRSLRRDVALKFVHASRVASRRLDRFAREARAGGRLHHPGIVTVHAYGRSGGLSWIAMELVEGGRTLADVAAEAARTGVLSRNHDERIARLVAEVADAVHAAHEAGVIHRDLKPQNILIAADGHPLVTDFGLAWISGEEALSVTGDFAGTYLYASPEQVAAKPDRIDHRTDVFSLGVVLYQLLALRRPFEGDSPHQVAAQIVGKDPPDLRTIRSRIPRDLALIVAKALEKDPDARYATMRDLAQDLRRYLAHEPVSATAPTLRERCMRWVQRNPGRSFAAGFAAVAFGVVGLLLAANVRANRALTGAVVLARENERRADQEAQRAEQRAADVLRLSAMTDLADLVAQADELWPVRPERIDAYQDWIARARRLTGDLPLHREKLAELLATASAEGGGRVLPLSPLVASLRGLPDDDGPETSDADREARWWSAQLGKLIDGLKGFERDLLASDAVTPERGWSVPRRLALARELATGFGDGGELRARWEAALADLRAAYPGLDPVPQADLLPLGPDPVSGLWEFAHLPSGEPAVRGPGGELVITEDSGIVLVLLPAGTFLQGAQPEDPGQPNYDPWSVKDNEWPVRAVSLEAFFLSKHEMTQGQWLRATGSKPSMFQDPEAPHARSHPVERVSWNGCGKVLGRLGLTMPTSAQWEYAARAGTDTVWWTGSEPTSLAGAANIVDQTAARQGPLWSAKVDVPELDDGYASTSPVGVFAANPFGLHDVHGNVWEWCLDSTHEDLDKSGFRQCILRGSSFNEPASNARCANIAIGPPEVAYPQVGVRPARVIEP